MGAESGDERVETVVIGAGQAGLATGYHLRRADCPFVMLDEHPRIGDVWRNRWDSLRLFTPARYDGLPGMRFPASPLTYPGKEQVADYFEAYAARFALPVRTGTRVDSVARDGDTLVVASGTGRWRADNVVIATGASHTPRIPPFAHRLAPSITQLHSSEYRNPQQLQDGPTLVVGAGNSGAEIAMEVSRDRPTWMSGPDTGQEPTKAGTMLDKAIVPLIWFMASRVLAVTNPFGRKVRNEFLDPPKGIPLGRVRRKEITAAGIERVPRTVGVTDGRPETADGTVLDVRNVVWCTGFVADYAWIDLDVFGDYGFPRHERGVVEDAPGLYFMGLPFQQTLSSALLGGVGPDAEYIVDHIAQRRRSQEPSAV